ncbi:hypothetical protein ETD86_37425 [Nonomuraea turkmeniaca]|uniref:Uncharacterized protein n=1 Tax=Nonomuraea turkmeniaca TaxID=103838 RepID=A0A5S4F4L2_9ACTN|nr:hypothetical protein [Nonomuraea turkmeniaca]TMR10999.1 hypothetical protein ETD86_37425 [Nonomuraea turkmeniaca]
MPRYVLKPAPNVDVYVIFSTVVMGTTWEGNRAALKELYADGGTDPAEVAELLARADATGTSDKDGTGGWDDPGELFLYELS